MGIAGLLPQLRSITRRAHVSMYRGQTVAVDAYCLLHRGSYSCARELVEGEPTNRHVQYCMGRIELLLAAGVRPIVVFDGGRLPNKADEERSRERSREENKARARALWAQGNKAAAMECYQKSVDIQPAHAKQFVEALKQRNIPYIVAPYEADAQMAYLALNNLVDAVLTEDSDLLCYGCPTVFFKMDKGGDGEEVRLADLPAAKELAFQGFGHELFQEMCVLAGCDFAASLPGIGIKKAHQHLRRTRCFLKVVRALRFDGVKIPEGYERRVQRALWTFKHQRVYCPRRRAVVHLHEVVGGELAMGARVPAAAQLEEGEPDFLGPPLPDEVASAIAVGDLDPITKLPFGDELQLRTAPLAADAAASGCGTAGGQRAAPSGRQQKASGRGGSGSQQGQPPAASGGPILKYVLRGLTKPCTSADFKAPRVQQQQGSQGSVEQTSMAAASGSGQQGQQQQQQQHGQEDEVLSPAAAARQPATGSGDTLASPTEEQWAQFRRRQRKGSSRAPPAAPTAAALTLSSVATAAAPAQQPLPMAAVAAAAAGEEPALAALRTGAGPATSKYFRPSGGVVVGGLRRSAGRPQAGGLMATLRAALHGEPSVEQLLNEQAAGAALDPAAGSEDEGGVDGAPQQRLGGGRSRFVVPHRQSQQQQEQPAALQALGLQSSPTIDDLLDGSSVGTGEEEEQELPSARCSPGVEAPMVSQRPSQRAWLPQRAAATQQAAAATQVQAAAQRRAQAQQDLLDLMSPGGHTFLQQQQGQPDEGGGGITPGFYGGGGSEAGSGARLLTSLPRRPPAIAPGSATPPLQGFHRQPQLGSSAERRRDSAAEEGGMGAGSAGPFCSEIGDPIASLSHVAAFQPKAEAAIARATAAALAATAQKAFPPLPPPPRHLQQGIAAAVAAVASDDELGMPALTPAAGKRPLLAGVEKENCLLQVAGSKRRRGGSSAAPASSNPFAGFALH